MQHAPRRRPGRRLARLLAPCLLALALAVGIPARAGAEVSAPLRVFPIVDGQVDTTAAPIGQARLSVWGRTTSTDPYAATLGPVAALATIDFFAAPVGANLGLIQAPSGALRTTLGVVSLGQADPSVRGSWVIGNGAAIAGGDADDLVVAGVWIADTAQPLGAAALDVSLLWGSPGVAEPTGEATCSSPLTDSGGCVGSFFGVTGFFGPGAVRADTARFSTVNGSWQHLLVIAAGADEYLVVACRGFVYDVYPVALGKECTLSGTGPMASAISGRVDYARPLGSISTTLAVSPFLVAPGMP